jgi:transcription-repair coupling factor (superfamily II helicase)
MLTLTATPIPRTLAMSLEGLRDLSVIATAPPSAWRSRPSSAKFAGGDPRSLLRELLRGGQVYFLHNEVDTIANMRERLEALLPEARIVASATARCASASWNGDARLLSQRFNVLLCSTIIETGIDIPTANTIIINRADKFGLAQLHQLRGRVGRSHHQAYAYLLTPDEEAHDPGRQKAPGSHPGWRNWAPASILAMHDLEIRGAGEVLGESSGEMHGSRLQPLHRHARMPRCVAEGRQGARPDAPLGVTTEINLHAPALLPNDYCHDVHERLVLYKRLANCDNEDHCALLQEELIDRFGELPDADPRADRQPPPAPARQAAGHGQKSTPAKTQSSCSSCPTRRSTRSRSSC